MSRGTLETRALVLSSSSVFGSIGGWLTLYRNSWTNPVEEHTIVDQTRREKRENFIVLMAIDSDGKESNKMTLVQTGGSKKW